MNTINISVSYYSKVDGPSSVVKTVKLTEAASMWSAVITEAMGKGYIEIKSKKNISNPYWRGICQRGKEIAVELKLNE